MGGNRTFAALWIEVRIADFAVVQRFVMKPDIQHNHQADDFWCVLKSLNGERLVIGKCRESIMPPSSQINLR
jgi:hypothetical protein